MDVRGLGREKLGLSSLAWVNGMVCCPLWKKARGEEKLYVLKDFEMIQWNALHEKQSRVNLSNLGIWAASGLPFAQVTAGASNRHLAPPYCLMHLPKAPLPWATFMLSQPRGQTASSGHFQS